MSVRYGFELEGFNFSGENLIPPSYNMPVDGFPGLVELRTTGGKTIEKAFAQLVQKYLELPKHHFINFSKCEAVFTGDQMQWMRKNMRFEKSQVDVQNIYGKPIRRIGNKTLASFQINISNCINDEYTDEKGVIHQARYGLLNINKIVKDLDKEFNKEIKISNRQPGMYAIKGNYRLEYRSLPNFVYSFDPYSTVLLMNRISKICEG